jgi:hypothetical protein
MAREDRGPRGDREEPRSNARTGSDREFTNRDWEIENAPSDPERRRKFRQRWASTYLPDLPTKDGWHRCWCSTTHGTDTIARRLALGYRILKQEELTAEGWDFANYSSSKDVAALDGNVRWREMIAMECPEELYQETMREFHHDLPYDMARDIYAPFTDGRVAEQITQAGGRIQMTDGSREFIKFRRPPRQFE